MDAPMFIERRNKIFVKDKCYPNFVLYHLQNIPNVKECFLNSELGIIETGSEERFALETERRQRIIRNPKAEKFAVYDHGEYVEDMTKGQMIDRYNTTIYYINKALILRIWDRKRDQNWKNRGKIKWVVKKLNTEKDIKQSTKTR